jgi:tape measure domain-containing protein
VAGEALRSLYAEVGWKIDDAPLRRLDKLLDEIKASMLGGAVERFEKELADASDEAEHLGDELKKTGKEAKTALDKPTDQVKRLKREMKESGDQADRARTKFQRFGSAAYTALQKASILGARLSSSIFRLGGAILRAPFSLPGMVLGGMASYGAVRYGFMNPLQVASEFEQAEIAFTTMLGSAEKARKFIDEMNRFAIETPFELAGVQDAAKRMLAFGFRQEQIIPYLTAIGNAAAGLGGGTDLIDRISLAIGQMQAKAKVSAEEMLQLTEAGIPAWEILATKMNKSTREVMDLSSKGLIPASEAIEMLIEGMNERFPDMLKKQAESLDGLKSQIMETFNLVVVKRWGDGLAQALKPRFQQLNQWIEDNDDKIQRWGRALERVAYEGFDYLMRQGERAFSYIRIRYLENEEFQSLPFNKKIDYVLSDIKSKFDAWYDSGGRDMIEDGTAKLVQFGISVLEDSLPKVTDVGKKAGVALGAGLWEGFREKIAEHPFLSIALSTVAGGAVGSRFGPWGTAAGAGVGFVVGASGTARAVGDAKEAERIERQAGMADMIRRLEEKPKDQPLSGWEDTYMVPIRQSWWDRLTSKFVHGSHASGLPYVPKDDYIARLHEGERVLTKAENRRYMRDRFTAVSPSINATIHVNVSAAAAAGGAVAVREAARQGAREGMEEFWRSLRRNYPAVLEV